MHGLRVLQVGGPQGIVIAQCLCDWIGSPKAGAVWTVEFSGDGTAKIRPSIDWPGHFHETFDRAPVGKVDFDRRDAAFPVTLRTTTTEVHAMDEKREPTGDTSDPAPAEPIADSPTAASESAEGAGSSEAATSSSDTTETTTPAATESASSSEATSASSADAAEKTEDESKPTVFGDAQDHVPGETGAERTSRLQRAAGAEKIEPV